MRHALLTLLLSTTVLAQNVDLDPFQIDAERYLTHVRTLASDELAGRGNGTVGLQRAADYIASEFEKARLQPGGDQGTYFQTFDVSSRLEDTATTLLCNVVGVLKGADPSLASEAIVIGGHYDHLGFGSRFSRDARSTGQIHNGADDNASGVSMVIEMAHTVARERARFKRSVVFATFAGEELGLLGSRHYVQHAPISMQKTVAMLNLDMVGRAHGRVLVGGRPQFRRLLGEVRPLSKLRLDDFREGYGDGASDNASFEREHVPTLVFFTGFHADYHRPSDDWERIDVAGAAEIAKLALAITAKLATGR